MSKVQSDEHYSTSAYNPRDYFEYSNMYITLPRNKSYKEMIVRHVGGDVVVLAVLYDNFLFVLPAEQGPHSPLQKLNYHAFYSLSL